MSFAAETLGEEELPPKSALEKPPSNDDLPTTVIEHGSNWRFLDLRELWRYRELLFFLAWRDVKVRYKQTIFGALWAILQPMATMVVLWIVFGRQEQPQENVTHAYWPYPLFGFSGLLPWYFFASSISSSGQSVVGNQNLVTKIYFPRIIIPIAATGACIVDFLAAVGMLIVLMLSYWIFPGWSVVLAPVIFLELFLAAVGVGTLLAALTVAYRDFRYVVPFLVQLWMFATPCLFLRGEIVFNPLWKALLPLNPAQGLIFNFRAAVLNGPIDWYALGVSSLVSIGLFVVGCFYFHRVERGFADII